MYPIILLSITGLLTLFLGFNKNRNLVFSATVFFLILSLASIFIDWNSPGQYFNYMIEVNNNILVISSILIFSTLLIVLLSSEMFTDELAHPAEYYAIIQFALAGAIIMVSFQNLLMFFVGLEILSISLYILTGSDKRNLRGNEAALKYFLMGSFATGILLFGIAMLYGATGTFSIFAGQSMAGMAINAKIFLWIGMIMILIGLLFKVSAAPFHFWTADVYQGAPAIFTAFMATIVKTAGFYALYKIMKFCFGAEYAVWSNLVFAIIILSLIVGNITAVYQDNFKRMLAYSSVSQAGFMLFSILGLNTNSGSNLGFYASSYALATISAFGVLIVVSSNSLKDGRPNENIEVFNGLFKRNSLLAIVLLISMLSLSGIPLTSGFWSKFFVLNDSASKGNLWILVIAILMSAVSLYYYFKPVRASFSDANIDAEPIVLPYLSKIVLIICAVLTLLLGIAPQILKNVL